jgi:hypothetical protein
MTGNLGTPNTLETVRKLLSPQSIFMLQETFKMHNSIESYFDTTQNNYTTKSIENLEIYYNYIYLDPRNPGKYSYENLNFSLLFEPFYIGYGKNNRKYSHLKEARKGNSGDHPKIAKIKKIQKVTNQDPYILQLNSKISKSIAIDNEIILINNIGRLDINLGPLTNMTNGGDGGRTRLITYQQGKTGKEIWGDSWKDPKLGIKFKERFGENWTNPKQGKKLTDYKGIDYTNERKNKSYKAQYGTEKALEISNKISKAMKEKFPEGRIDMGKPYILINPNNEILLIKGLNRFCKTHNLNHTRLFSNINKGIITVNLIGLNRKRNLPNALNCNNWEIRTIEFHKSLVNDFVYDI